MMHGIVVIFDSQKAWHIMMGLTGILFKKLPLWHFYRVSFSHGILYKQLLEVGFCFIVTINKILLHGLAWFETVLQCVLIIH